MKTLSFPIVFCLGLLVSTAISADMLEATQAYHEKNYPAAFKEYKQLAELGNKKAQFNLGVMYLKGQGVKPDPIEAYAWMKVANEEPNNKVTKALRIIEESLPQNALAVANKRAAERLAAYGKQALYPLPASKPNRPPNPESQINDYPVAIAASRVPPRYPAKMLKPPQQGWLTLGFDVMPDGSVSNIYVLDSFPPGGFDKEAIAALEKWKFDVKYAPGESPAPIPMTQIIEFKLEGNITKNRYGQLYRDYLKKVRDVAETGNPEAQYLYAIVAGSARGIIPDEWKLSPSEVNQWLLKAAQNGHKGAQYSLARNIYYGRGAQAEPQKALFWLQQAANNGENRASRMLYDVLRTDVARNRKLVNTTGRSAEEWLALSAEAGNPDAMLTWADLLSRKQDPTPQDIAKAREYLQKARSQRKPGLRWLETSARLYRLAGNERKARKEERKLAKLHRKIKRELSRTDIEVFNHKR